MVEGVFVTVVVRTLLLCCQLFDLISRGVGEDDWESLFWLTHKGGTF